MSGPLKRLLVDKLAENKIGINRKGIVREKKDYDSDIEVEICEDDNVLHKKYNTNYIYSYNNVSYAVDKQQIEESCKESKDHFVICHAPEVIKQIKQDFSSSVQLLNIKFKNYQKALGIVCKGEIDGMQIDDDVDKRRQKIDSLSQKLEDAEIYYDIEITVDNTQISDYVGLSEKLWETLRELFTGYFWSDLLNKNKRDKKNKDTRFFEDDKEIIINSAAFRRLQDKAQVFPLEKGDYARTRLTHSYECSKIAKQLGVYFVEMLNKKKSDTPSIKYTEECEQIPELLENAALIHDMGNPPFGHFGEEIIRNWFKEKFDELDASKDKDVAEEPLKSLRLLTNEQMKNDLLKFEGNAQLFRLISKYTVNNKQRKYEYELTNALLSVIIKYPTRSDKTDKSKLQKKKCGYFYSEMEEFKRVQKVIRINNGTRHPLTFLLEAADDIAYLTSDLQDGHHKKIIPFYEILKLENFDKNKQYTTEEEIDIVKNFHSKIRKDLIKEAIQVFDENYDSIMNGTFDKALLELCETNTICEAIKELLKKYVYIDEGIIKSEIISSTILSKLMDVFVLATLDYNPNKESSNPTYKRIHHFLSDNYKNNFSTIFNSKISDDKKIYHKILLATDHICGMTDSYAQQMYNMVMAYPTS